MFQLNDNADIKSINVAKGKGEEAPVCVTIGLEFDQVGPDPVAASLGCRESDLSGWFSKEGGECLFTGIQQIESWADFEDKHKISMLGFRCDVTKVSRIRVRPRGSDSFWLACNIQLQNPPDHVIEKIASNLHLTSKVKLEAEPELPLEQPMDEAA